MQPGPINLLPPQSPLERERIRPRRCLFFVGMLLIILIGGCISGAIFTNDLPADPDAYDPVTLEPKRPEGILGRLKHLVVRPGPALEGQEKDRINFLILGQGGPGHDGPYLTDTIILTSIEPSTGKIAFVSIPRDLAVDIPGYGVAKMNHANAVGENKKEDGGPSLAREVTEKTFDININYVVRVDFHAFEEIIDEVGGISIDVERSFIDSEYPAPNYEYQTVSFRKGVQTMDGDTALTFVRSRHGSNGEGSDFARSKRQQKVLLALKEKILSFQTLSNPIKIHGILQSLRDNVVTDMAFSDIIAVLKLAKALDTSNIITLTLDDSPTGYLRSGYTQGGAFILEPNSGSFDEINTAITNIFETPPTLTQDTTPPQEAPAADYRGAIIEVQNGTWRAGLGARARQALLNKKFDVRTVGNTNLRPIAQSGIFIIDRSADSLSIAGELKTELIIPIKEAPPEGEHAATSTDILVILGDDFES